MSRSTVLPAKATAFERRMANNPYAFLTRLIQAAPESPEVQAWIVPEGIIPHKISTSSTPDQDSNRSGMGKWVYSGSNIMESMVKEGKYKMMNSSAYARPDMAQLVYAQWTIRLAHDILELLKTARVPPPLVTLTKEPSKYADDSRQLFQSPQSKGLQCVLYFKHTSDTNPRPNDDRSLEQCPTFDISQPSLPTLMSRSLVLQEVTIHGKKGGPSAVPLYDMEQLFHNHPNGYKAILHACHKQLPTAKDQASDNLGWVGLVESQSSVPVAVGLWKLASMLPK
ncbi:hypothetical protein BGZ58_006200 [Dissophora ornata]|nr:hypothetical protein BGZ58_006200 [Dissophora ornata]